jgi:hypothetical protein
LRAIWPGTPSSIFYSGTIDDSPALFGEDAANVHYHLEALVLFARSSLDIAAAAFGELLPSPFPRKRYDSFNDLLKAIAKSATPAGLAGTIQSKRLTNVSQTFTDF